MPRRRSRLPGGVTPARRPRLPTSRAELLKARAGQRGTRRSAAEATPSSLASPEPQATGCEAKMAVTTSPIGSSARKRQTLEGGGCVSLWRGMPTNCWRPVRAVALPRVYVTNTSGGRSLVVDADRRAVIDTAGVSAADTSPVDTAAPTAQNRRAEGQDARDPGPAEGQRLLLRRLPGRGPARQGPVHQPLLRRGRDDRSRRGRARTTRSPRSSPRSSAPTRPSSASCRARKVTAIKNFYETAVSQPPIPGTVLLFTAERLRFEPIGSFDNVGNLEEPRQQVPDHRRPAPARGAALLPREAPGRGEGRSTCRA